MRHRHAMPFGAEMDRASTRFALWAPSADEVTLVLDGQDHAMPPAGEGWRRLVVPGVAAGARYGFRIGDLFVPDPASRFQPDDVKGASAVVDPAAFDWPDDDWRGRPWEEAVISEIHVGTATRDGTFAALAETLPDLAALGVTAIELMPIGEFHGRRNWGYDGVLPYAPDAAYGTPDDLKRLVARAHSLGLMVFLDVVYNHFGPVGNYLHGYAASFFTERHPTPWGAGLNVDGADGRPVRDFFIENALFWLDEYRMDGLRLDAVHAIRDESGEHLLGELARRARALAPDRHIHLILENEHNEAGWLERDADHAPIFHTAQWNDDIHHCWHVLLTGERDSYYASFADDPVGRLRRGLAEGFVYQGEGSLHGEGGARGTPSAHLPPAAFVNFLQNHDQVGNRAFGDRLAPDPDRLALARAALLLAPQIPMLFMGEEWGASTPFRFFVDYDDDPDLARAVREGRRREFRHFPAFADEAAAAAIPDPNAEATFAASVLDRAEASRPPHDAILADTRRLLAIRSREIVPVTRSRFLEAETLVSPLPHAEAPLRGAPQDEEGGSVQPSAQQDRGGASAPADRLVDIRWRYEAGSLRLAILPGEGSIARSVDPGERIVWHSPALRPEAGGIHLFPWTGFVTVGARA
ncbi:malto-oligosyltrehalose trehalohydrolase [Enterovirga rhinocerotis]|uniref:Malto-oligosyltrehalose trehalohydrolase n=1 Tax=Enterovirga rhinocerotis TaxID=1339210 RepID=A0A4R7C047_9HYPH|nr:malto-oligosyltrehalose trehalohydrolase [Enterovirga rhinocerotis]TDR89746.1 maltooligosyl trehalose hydrolase [Enterovirga rhinocerotis]